MKSALARLAALVVAFASSGALADKPGSAHRPGTSIPLAFPVLLIGQGSLDVRDSVEALVAVRGHSSLNLVERRILDSRGRLFDVKHAELLASRSSFLLSMGNNDQLFFLDLKELPTPTIAQARRLAIAELRAPNSSYRESRAAVDDVEARQSVPALIEAARDKAGWTR